MQLGYVLNPIEKVLLVFLFIAIHATGWGVVTRTSFDVFFGLLGGIVMGASGIALVAVPSEILVFSLKNLVLYGEQRTHD